MMPLILTNYRSAVAGSVGTTWTQRYGTGLNTAEFAAYSGALYVVNNGNLSSSGIWSNVSSDGINWTPNQLTSDATQQVVALIYGQGKFVQRRTTTSSAYPTYISTDGVNWTIANIGTGTINLIPYTSSTSYIIFYGSVGSLNKIRRVSSLFNGSFTDYTPPVFGSAASTYVVGGMAYINSLYWIFGLEITDRNNRYPHIYKSSNLTSWTEVGPFSGFGFATDATIFGLAYGNSTYVAVSGGSYVYSTTDNWATYTISSLPTYSVSSGKKQIFFANGLFIVITNKGILTSSDGINWTALSVDVKNYTSICGSNTQLVVGTSDTTAIPPVNNGYIYSSI